MIKVIKTAQDYDDYGPAFERSAKRWGMMSFDTEDLFSAAQKNTNTPTKLALILVATPDGRILIFDMRCLSNVPLKERTKADIHAALPPAFRRLLIAPRVLKTGSSLTNDVGVASPTLGVQVAPIKDRLPPPPPHHAP